MPYFLNVSKNGVTILICLYVETLANHDSRLPAVSYFSFFTEIESTCEG